jgi:TatA/E family protein of Tat protein translocase
MQQQLLAIGMPGPFEWVIIAGIGLLIFGKRLPSVGRNLALSIRGFQQGMKDTGGDEQTAAPQLATEERKSLPDQR